jgi:hypothetical protein
VSFELARDALTSSRVDLVAVIDGGIPPREYLPGSGRALPKGKRLHVTAQRKSGKSLLFGVVIPVEVIASGASVVVLDRENGADEYARRLAAVLDARQADPAFREAVRERLSYHAWPSLRLDWGDDPSYPEAFDDAELVVFDSTRSHTAALGLRENESDDYSRFTAALIDPLSRAGRTVAVLDNTGHEAKDRPRGTTAKEDLCDVSYTLRQLAPFSAEVRGRAVLAVAASRIGEVAGSWQVVLGGGHYGSLQRSGGRPPEARDDLHEAALAVLVEAGGTVGVKPIRQAVRDRGLRFADHDLEAALRAWAVDPMSGLEAAPGGGFRSVANPHATVGGRERPRDASRRLGLVPVETPVDADDLGVAKGDATACEGGRRVSRSPYGGATLATGGATKPELDPASLVDAIAIGAVSDEEAEAMWRSQEAAQAERAEAGR